MTLLLYIAASLLLCGLPCTIHSTDSSTATGKLVSIDKQQATILVNDAPQTVPLDQIQKLTGDQSVIEQRPDSSFLIRLIDDSQIIAKQMTVKSGVVGISSWPLNGSVSSPQETSRKNVRSVRFRIPSDQLDSQWAEIVATEHEGDTLVIRKSATSLDYLDGVVISMDDESILFEYAGDEIPVKRTKLEGILFYQRGTAEEQPEPAFVATLCNGTRLRGNALTVADDAVTITTLAGVQWSDSLQSLSNVNYAIGRTLFLSDTDPAELTVTPHIASSLDDALTQLLYKPRRNVTRGNRPLTLRFPDRNQSTESFSKGLCLHSRTEITYRLGKQYSQFHTLAGIAPELGERGAVKLVISADDETLFEETIEGGQAPVAVDLNVAGRRRLTIVVDYADKLDVADRIHLCDLRVTK